MPLLAGGLAFIGLHRILSARRSRLGRLAARSGAVRGSVGRCSTGWAVGTWSGSSPNSSDTYGVFVVVFGLLSWCLLLGTVFLYSNELSVVLADRRWPRSMTGRNLSDVDQESLAMLAEREVRVRGTDIDVHVPENPKRRSPDRSAERRRIRPLVRADRRRSIDRRREARGRRSATGRGRS